MTKRMMTTLLSVVLLMSRQHSSEFNLYLTSLHPDCQLILGQPDGGGPLPAVWLACEGRRIRQVEEAGDVQGKVSISSAEQALELVRLVSGGGRWHLFSGSDAVAEVTEGNTRDPYRFVVSALVFQDCCRRPEFETKIEPRGERNFVVRRTVVDRDYKVMWLSQAVAPDGAVGELSRTVIGVKGRRLGRFLDWY